MTSSIAKIYKSNKINFYLENFTDMERNNLVQHHNLLNQLDVPLNNKSYQLKHHYQQHSILENIISFSFI
jgi:hypothetical protein